MVNGPVVEPAVTVTLGGTFKLDNPLLLSVTRAPPLGAAFDSVTVHVPPEFELNIAGLHCNEETTMEEPVKLSVTLCEDPL